MECGDHNIEFFHQYAYDRKNINSIWNIKTDEGIVVEGFDDITSTGIQHFEKLFKEDNIFVANIVKITQLFPSSVSDEHNEMLMEEVLINELKEILGQFNLIKSLVRTVFLFNFTHVFFICLGMI